MTQLFSRVQTGTGVAGTGTWSAAGPLPAARFWAPPDGGAVVLTGDKVVVAGGEDGRRQAVSDAALFDSATGTWTATGSLQVARRLHSTTRLVDGRVLVAGGVTGPLSLPVTAMSAVEIYDPANGQWSRVADLREARYSHSASLLPDGKVLVAGGCGFRSATTNRALGSAEVFDPVTGAWSAAPAMTEARFGHPAVSLTDGRVLMVGGVVTLGIGQYTALALCELYDPSTRKWSPTGNLTIARKSHQATRLLDGTVLVTGGDGRGLQNAWTYEPYSQVATELFEPTTGRWTSLADMPWGRSHHRDVLLASGEVLQVGGLDDGSFDVGYRNAMIFDPAARSWRPAAAPQVGRFAFATATVGGGRVLIAGGVTRSGAASTEPGADVLTAETEIFAP